MPELTVQHLAGDLFDVQADAIVNPWNRNFVPRWILRPGGVSGELKKRTGPEPWDELAGRGLLRLGEAVLTPAGRCSNAKAIIHVAGLNVRWRASAQSVELSVGNAVRLTQAHQFGSIVMPLIGAGHGGLSPATSLRAMMDALERAQAQHIPAPLVVTIVRPLLPAPVNVAPVRDHEVMARDGEQGSAR